MNTENLYKLGSEVQEENNLGKSFHVEPFEEFCFIEWFLKKEFKEMMKDDEYIKPPFSEIEKLTKTIQFYPSKKSAIHKCRRI